MTKIKWFFPIQKQVREYLTNNYDSCSLNSQNVHPEFVYESYSCTKAESNIQVLIMMNKRQQFAVYEMAALINVK